MVNFVVHIRNKFYTIILVFIIESISFIIRTLFEIDLLAPNAGMIRSDLLI